MSPNGPDPLTAMKEASTVSPANSDNATQASLQSLRWFPVLVHKIFFVLVDMSWIYNNGLHLYLKGAEYV